MIQENPKSAESSGQIGDNNQAAVINPFNAGFVNPFHKV